MHAIGAMHTDIRALADTFGAWVSCINSGNPKIFVTSRLSNC